jgi:hypothetical protein
MGCHPNNRPYCLDMEHVLALVLACPGPGPDRPARSELPLAWLPGSGACPGPGSDRHAVGQNCLWPGYLDLKHVPALALAGLQGQNYLWPGYLV